MNKELKELIATGINCIKKSNWTEAESIFYGLIKKYPHNVTLYTYLIPCLIQLNKIDDALKFANDFYLLSKKSEISINYLGIINFKNKNYLDAINYFNRVLEINNNNYDALVNKGFALLEINNISEAKNTFYKAIEINPQNPIAYGNYAAALEEEANIEDSKKYLLKAIKLNSKDYHSIHSLSLLQLLTLDFLNGWKNYELRWYHSAFKKKYINIPKLKTLKNLDGKKILIWSEQGLGDTINFSRYIKSLIKLNADITFEVQGPLVSFFKKNFECSITHKADETIYDFQSPLLSLPYIFQTSEKNTIAASPYLCADDQKVLFWKNELKLSKDKINLGIAISGNQNHLKEKRRSIELSKFGDFLKYCKIFIIQKNSTTDIEKNINNFEDILFLGTNKNWEDFSDTSAIVTNMDLIISIDTSLIHLAGSMNKKSILLLSKPSDWRWGLNEKNSIKWYDSVKILRQDNVGDWESPIKDAISIVNEEYLKKK